MAERAEVIIVGGGIIGATAACALAHADIDVILLDMHAPHMQWENNTTDLRVSALTQASANILKTLDVWPDMIQRGVCCYRDMKVWDGNGDGYLNFDCADTDFNELGHIVENRVTIAALWHKLQSLPSSQCLTGHKISSLQLADSQAELTLDNGKQLSTPLLIAADGRESFLRQQAGISVTGWPYRQDGLVATITTDRPHQHTAWQRFLDEGPLAFLPLHNGQCSIVWTLSTETAQSCLQLNEQAFLDKLHQASGGILGDMLATSQRAAFPLKFQYANHYCAPHMVLAGDAAHAMHPLAGQGANAGLLDAATLAELVIKGKQAGRPMGSQKILRQYERQRKGDNLLMMSAMDVLNKTFAHHNPAFSKLRSGGMNWINHSAQIKNMFNQHAMGLRSDIPLLAQSLPCW